MATLRQIVLKAVELKEAAETLEKLRQDAQITQTRLNNMNDQITVQQGTTLTLRDELKALINE